MAVVALLFARTIERPSAMFWNSSCRRLRRAATEDCAAVLACAAQPKSGGGVLSLQDRAEGWAGMAGRKLGSAAGRAGGGQYLSSGGTEESW